jgi:hypothetical protein
MGSGGYAARPQAVAAPDRLAQRRQVEKAAYSTDFGFDASSLQDLQLPAIDEAGPLCGVRYEADPFAAGPLDASLWGDMDACNPYEAHPFGTLAVDALFALPGSLPGSPLKGGAAAGGPSPFNSPLRAPGSPAPATPTLPAPAAAAADGSATPSPAPAPPVPTVTSIPLLAIETGHASTGAADVVVVAAPRAAKRPAEEPADAGRSPRRRRSDGAESDDSDASALSLERDDILPVLLAAPLDSQAQVEAALPDLPTSQQTSCGEVVTLSPTLWRDARRDAHPPFRIHVNAGLHSMRAPGVEAPITLFGAIHPRIITTGQPHRRLGRSRLGRAPEAPPAVTRQTRGNPERAIAADLRREKSAEQPACQLQEVWLLKRELARGGEPAVLDAFQCAEFDGTTLTATPAWGGPFAVDVVACVAEPSGGTFWIKAQNRSVQNLSS